MRSADWIALLARTMLAALFLVSGVRKITGYAGTLGYMTKFGVPMVEALLVLTIVVEIAGGLMLIFGYKARFAAALLALFVLIVTPIFHAFWAVEPAQFGNQLNHFLKNASVVGGLLYVLAFGAGSISIDERRRIGPGVRSRPMRR